MTSPDSPAGSAILHAGRHPEPRERHDPRIHSRGRRARVRTRTRVRCRVRQPRFDRRRGRRRWRSGDRPPGGLLERDQFPEPGAGWRGASRSSTSTATRSAALPCWRVPHRRVSPGSSHAHGYEVRVVGGDEPDVGPSATRATLDQCYARIREIQPTHDGTAPGRSTRPPAGLPSCCARPKAGPGRRRSTVSQSPVPSAPTKCPSWRRSQTPRSCIYSKSGFGATSQGPCSLTRVRLCLSWRRSHRRASRRMGANPHANGGQAASKTLVLPDYASTLCPCRVPRNRATRVNPRISARCCVTSSSDNARSGELPPLLPGRNELEPIGRRLRGRESLPGGSHQGSRSMIT